MGPGSVQRSNFRRAAVYPLNFLITYGRMMVVYSNDSLLRNRVVFSTGATLEFLNGLLNTVTYAMQSRYAAMLWKRYQRDCELRSGQGERSGANETALTLSFHVDIGGVDIVEVLASVTSSFSEPIVVEDSYD